MAPLMIAGTALQAIGTIANGQQAAAIGARNADVLTQQANETDRATVRRPASQASPCERTLRAP